MERAIVITFVKFVDAQGNTHPDDPAFKIGFTIIHHKVVSKAEAPVAQAFDGVKVSH